MAGLQVMFLLISTCLLGSGPHLSAAMVQLNNKDVLHAMCTQFSTVCPCAANKLIVTEAGKENAWTCGSNIAVKSLEKWPTVKIPLEMKIDMVQPFIHFIYIGCKYVVVADPCCISDKVHQTDL